MSPAERKAFAETIKPAVKGQSDRFSWRLYQRALKRGRESVYFMAWSSINGYVLPDAEQLKSGFVPAHRLAIGVMSGGQWFHGCTVRQISTPGSPRHDWAYGPGHHTAEWVDVTDWFWSSYAMTGRCLFWKNEHDWLQINRNARKCKHCGEHQRRTVVTIKKIERREAWA